MELGSALRSAGLVGALGGLVVALAVTGIRLERQGSAGDDGVEPVYLPKAEYLRPMSLGYANVLADVLWFRTISYFGRHYRSDRTYPWLAQMCDLVTDLDPRAEHVYRFAGVILPWEANQADAGLRLLQKGAAAFPDSWLMQYYLGFNYYFFKNDYEGALRHLRRATELPGAHPSVGRLVAVLALHQYDPDTTLQFLADLEQRVDSTDMRAVVRTHMQEAQLAADLDRLGAAVTAYRAGHGHLPASLDALVTAGVLDRIPPDPFGGRYEIDAASGAVRSSTGREPSRLHQSRIREKAMQGVPVRDL